MDYSSEAWERLGSAIRERRRRYGPADTKVWASRVGRTSRTLLGLERGERTGWDTVLAVADALGWTEEVVNGLLDGEPPFWYYLDYASFEVMVTRAPDVADEIRKVQETDRLLHDGAVVSAGLADATDEELLAELRVRLGRRPIGSASSESSVAVLRNERFRDSAQPVKQAAGRTRTRPGESGPESQDPGDMEPR